jgi:hypothetical protein
MFNCTDWDASGVPMVVSRCARKRCPNAAYIFLNVILLIGSKFKGASTRGPQSQPNIANGEHSGSVVFFGKLP